MAKPSKPSTQKPVKAQVIATDEELKQFDSEEDTGGDEPAEENTPVAVKPMARVYKGTTEIDHDLYKLGVSKMKRNVGLNGAVEIIELEHCHIFHTVDSNGRPQTTCSPVGGHHHEIEVIPQADGVPLIKMSGPRKWIKKRVRGKLQRVSVPVRLGVR